MQTIKFIQKALGIVRREKCAALAPVIGGIVLAAGSSGLMAAEVTYERLGFVSHCDDCEDLARDPLAPPRFV